MSSRSEFTYISIFAGCGGSSLGYKMAGGRGLCAVEFDANAAATYRLNFPDTPVIERDVREVTAADVMDAAGLRVGELDVLDGSPPCQGFSTAGKRRMADPRNDLFAEFVRLVEGLQPRAFVMENVSGLVKGKMKLLFREMMTALKATGYRVRCKLLDAKWFGVPQTRKRLIWVGARPDLGREPEFPEPRGKLVTVRNALCGQPLGEPGKHQPQVIEAWHTARLGQALRKAVPYVGSFHSYRLDPDVPAPTQIKAHSHWHWAVPRHLTVRETALISSYPEDFQWPSGAGAARELIGNSVPPLFARAVAERVRDTLLTTQQEAAVT